MRNMNLVDNNSSCLVDVKSIMIDERDGKIYRTVELAGLRWMAENLDVGVQVTRAKGLNDYEIPYRDIQAGPDNRELRLNRMRRIGLVAPARPESFRLFFSGFRLVERDEPQP